MTLRRIASNVFATSSSVVAPSRVYASDYAVPTPTSLTTAVLGMERAYVDGAGRTGRFLASIMHACVPRTVTSG